MELKPSAEQASSSLTYRLFSAIKEHRKQNKIERMSRVWEADRVRPVEFGGATSGPGDEAFEEFGKFLGLNDEDIAEAYTRAHQRVAEEHES